MTVDRHQAWLEIDLDAFAANISVLNQVAGGAALAVVVKANGYGHGAPAMAEAAIAAGAERVCVFNLDEAAALRRAGFSGKIVVLGYAPPAEAERALSLDVAPVVAHRDVVQALAQAAAAQGVIQPVHCKVESGMHRFGLPREALLEMAALVRDCPSLRLEGLCTQFPAADGPDPAATRALFQQFLAVARVVRAPLRHVANSATLLRFPEMALEMVRPGLSAYGLRPSRCEGAAARDLQPVLSWKAKIVQMHDVPAGRSISYGGAWTAARDSRIGVIPVGYADGWRRALSDRAGVLVHGRRAPVVGAVCMDMCMVDLTEILPARPGDVVVLVGEHQGLRNSVEEIAALCETIPYEILTGLGARHPRIYLRHGRPVAVQSLLDQAPVSAYAPSVAALLLAR